MANLLAFLQLSLEDPDFRACAQRHDATLERMPLLDPDIRQAVLREARGVSALSLRNRGDGTGALLLSPPAGILAHLGQLHLIN